MTNELEIFKNEEFGEIRTVTIDGEPWFAGKDITSALGRLSTIFDAKWQNFCVRNIPMQMLV